MKKLNSTFEKAEDSPGFMLWKASNLLQKLHSDCLKDLQVTPTQFSLMTCLVYLHQSGPVTPTRIVNHTGMDKMMVSDLVKTLIKKKLILRKNNPEDARSFIVEPTHLGEKITNQAIQRIEEVDEKYFKPIGNMRTFHQDLIAIVNRSST